ncbi:MAG: ABC transporter ATP-binding protein/permease [Beijerinckiaceae bacterium]
MAQSQKMTQAPTTASTSGDLAFMGELRAMISVLACSPGRVLLLALCFGLLIVVSATAYSQIVLNAWNEPFYDAINRRDVAGFMLQLQRFVGIAGTLLILNVAQMWLNQMMKLKVREGLTRHLIAEWLAPKRSFLLADAGNIGENPDQRIHEDARHLSEVSIDLGIGLFQASLLLASFIGVLWSLSTGVTFELWRVRFSVPGYMVWCALLYAGLASVASWRVGRPLIQLNAQRYALEADLRFALVHANEHSEGVAVYGSERREEAALVNVLDHLLSNLRLLVGKTTQLTWVVAGYGWFTIVAPTIVAAPAYFAGSLTLGGLIMAVGAFTQVQQSLRWFIDNSGTIADWRATLHRVAEFRSMLLEVDTIGAGASRIDRRVPTEERLVLDQVRIHMRSGTTALTQSRIEIRPGDHVLIVGEPGVGKTTLFRALAGLWPWGEGTIESPPAEQMMFLPKRPFISDGPLRDILAYPFSGGRFSDVELEAALGAVGLGHLIEALDRSARWDKDLTEIEQHSIAFARVLLHKPRWIVVDSALDALPMTIRRALFSEIDRQLPSMALIAIGSRDAEDAFFTTMLTLERTAGGLGNERVGSVAG